ncbi:TPA_asm: PAPS reductase [Altiarchaeum virus]|nr:TPA_asm: PAPS reductase [Altiarchaeum virus]
MNLEEKTSEAIMWLKEQNETNKEGFTVAFSGGKDSSVAYDLAKRAGIKINNVKFALSGVDPPELIRFVKDHYKEVIFVKPKRFMSELISTNSMPPTSKARYCCRYLHETFHGHLIAGVRREESTARRKYERIIRNKRWKTHILYLPLLAWTTTDIWDYIKERNLSYCYLYDAGFCRIGCIGCPLKSIRLREKDFLIWPAYKRYYVKSFSKMLQNGRRKYTWKSGEEVFEWWLKTEKIKTAPDPENLSIYTSENMTTNKKKSVDI